jgi:hypothetical protein
MGNPPGGACRGSDVTLYELKRLFQCHDKSRLLRQPKTAAALEGINSQQHVEEAFHNLISIGFALINAIGIGQCENWQARRAVALAQGSFKRTGTVVISVVSQKVQLLLLTEKSNSSAESPTSRKVRG